jgi:hypothetical protein
LDLANQLLGRARFRLATGTNAYFAELNRQRPLRDVIVCYSLNPQVHVFDELSVVETLEAQPATVYSAIEFCDRYVVISPITLRPTFSPNASVGRAGSGKRVAVASRSASTDFVWRRMDRLEYVTVTPDRTDR